MSGRNFSLFKFQLLTSQDSHAHSLSHGNPITPLTPLYFCPFMIHTSRRTRTRTEQDQLHSRVVRRLSGPLFTLCSQAEYRIQHLAQDTTPGAELTQLGYPYQTSGSTECARAIVASNYGGGGPQVSERLSIQGRVEIEGLCG